MTSEVLEKRMVYQRGLIFHQPANQTMQRSLTHHLKTRQCEGRANQRPAKRAKALTATSSKKRLHLYWWIADLDISAVLLLVSSERNLGMNCLLVKTQINNFALTLIRSISIKWLNILHYYLLSINMTIWL